MKSIYFAILILSIALGAFVFGASYEHNKIRNLPLFSETKYVLMPNAQLVFDKNKAWNDFTIQEKMFLCSFGSSGNKLTRQEVEEIWNTYGEDTTTVADRDMLHGIIVQKAGTTKPEEMYFPYPKKLNFSAMDKAIEILANYK